MVPHSFPSNHIIKTIFTPSPPSPPYPYSAPVDQLQQDVGYLPFRILLAGSSRLLLTPPFHLEGTIWRPFGYYTDFPARYGLVQRLKQGFGRPPREPDYLALVNQMMRTLQFICDASLNTALPISLHCGYAVHPVGQVLVC